MPDYIATWSVFILDQPDPVSAAKAARVLADDHFRSVWGVEDCATGDSVNVDLETETIVVTEYLDEDDDEEDDSVA